MKKLISKRRIAKLKRDVRIKSNVKKKMIPFALAVGALIILVGVLVYRQWKETQNQYFKLVEPTVASQVESSQTPPPESGGVVGLMSESEEVPSEENKDTGSVSLSEEMEGGTTSASGVETETEPDIQEVPVATPSTQPTTEETPTAEELAQQVVNDAVSTLYGYQTEFLTALEELYTRAKEDYLALPEEERTSENRDSIALGYAIEGAILEAECDNLVLALLADLTADLNELGASTDITHEIKESYVAEKTEKKAEYMSILDS